MSKTAYDAYIASDRWSAKRAAYWAEAGRSCKAKGCGSTHELTVHHHTYARLGNEQLSDLVGLCWRHHKAVHAYHHAHPRRGLTTATEQVTGLVLQARARAEAEREQHALTFHRTCEPPKRAPGWAEQVAKSKAGKPFRRKHAPKPTRVHKSIASSSQGTVARA